MPNCFNLTRKTAFEAGPVKLQDIDAELCQHFEEHCDDKEWFNDWYNYIGFSLALGKTFDQIKESIRGYIVESGGTSETWLKMLKITEYLDEHFIANAWYEHSWR